MQEMGGNVQIIAFRKWRKINKLAIARLGF